MKYESVEDRIAILASEYAVNLQNKVNARVAEMKKDDNRHYMLYNALGVSNEEGESIDVFQNKGRFLYKYAGSFVEEAVIVCFKHRFSDAESVKIPNTVSPRPKQYEIDCLVNKKDAFEIKWRDATTDGDHINKELARMRAVSAAGYKPYRLMFFEPLRGQAIKIQKKLEMIYRSEGGEYYGGEPAWEFIHAYTGVNLKAIINNLKPRVHF